MSDSTNRKQSHIDLSLTDSSQQGDAGFGDYRLVPEAFPEMAVFEVSLATTLLGRRLSFPFIVGAMTGGTQTRTDWNHQLARVAGAQEVALALGSLRAAVTDDSVLPQFDVRHHAESIAILGNIGAWQLRDKGFRRALLELVLALRLDGLYIHINPAQELVQPEGERDFAGAVDAVVATLEASEVPVFLKGVGCGISTRHMGLLLQKGLAGLDTSGLGGTHFPTVEGLRKGADANLAEVLRDWGVPTTEMIQSARQFLQTLPEMGTRPVLVASGGIRNAMDGAIAFALGADVISSAKPMLEALSNSAETLEERLKTLRSNLRALCLLTGARNPGQLRGRFRRTDRAEK